MRVTDKYVLFWRGPFSNWFPCTIVENGKKFNCAEQALMYAKAIFFEDLETANKILKADDPATQKFLGRHVNNFNEKAWESARENIMYHVLIRKFLQNPSLKKALLMTEDRIIAEASPVDKIWGIGLDEDNPDALYENRWKGRNLLGKALMRARKFIQEREK